MTEDIIEIANSLWASGNEEEAIALLIPLVEEGNIKAMASLGLIYCHFFKNSEFPKMGEGEKLLVNACKLGAPSACHNLGTLWLGNIPAIGKDRKKATRYYLKAKELGGQVADSEFYKKWEQVLHG